MRRQNISSRILKSIEFFFFLIILDLNLYLQIKDKQKKKQPVKGIRVNEDGDASLEDLTNSGVPGTDNDISLDPEGSKFNNKKVI